MRTISTNGGKEQLIKALIAACDNIKEDAPEIIGDISDVSKIKVTINMDANSVITYEVSRTKYAHLDEV